MRTIAAVTVLVTLIGTASVSLGQVEQLRLRVDGLACPFCAYSLQKRVRKLDGVEPTSKVDSFLDTGITVVPWNPAQPFEPAEIRKAIKESGFTLRDIQLTVSGAPSTPPNQETHTLDLISSGTGQIFHLLRDDRADHADSWDALVAYASGAGAGTKISVDGVVVEDLAKRSGSWRVALESWAPTVYGAEVEMKIDGFACERCSARTMRSLRDLEDVIHIEADHQTGFVRLWTTSPTPNLGALRQRITELGFTVTHAHVHKMGDETHDVSTMTGQGH